MSRARIVLVTLILVGLGIWLYLGPLGPEPGVDLEGPPHVADVVPRRFVLWELHPDDTVRVVELLTPSDIAGSIQQVNGQSLGEGDEVLALAFIGGELMRQETYEGIYRGIDYRRPSYWLQVSGDQYGYDTRITHPPHLHLRGKERLISIGIDPKSYAQEIIAIAIPTTAHVQRIYDYRPYRHVILSEWDVFYYDTTQITGHVSLHITYRPEGDAPVLDWRGVEASR